MAGVGPEWATVVIGFAMGAFAGVCDVPAHPFAPSSVATSTPMLPALLAFITSTVPAPAAVREDVFLSALAAFVDLRYGDDCFSNRPPEFNHETNLGNVSFLRRDLASWLR